MLTQQATIFKKKTQPAVSQESKKLQKAVDDSHRVLFRAKTVFPFDLFPDKVILDPNKVDLVYGLFIGTHEVFSIPYEKINSASSVTGLFMGSLTIEVTGYELKPHPVLNLKNGDAVRARRMINGLVTAHKMKIDLTTMNVAEISMKVEQIGTAQERN